MVFGLRMNFQIIYSHGTRRIFQKRSGVYLEGDFCNGEGEED